MWGGGGGGGFVRTDVRGQKVKAGRSKFFSRSNLSVCFDVAKCSLAMKYAVLWKQRHFSH